MKMERQVHQNLHILRKLSYSQSLKMVAKLFLSVSVFSFFFSHSSFLPFLHSLKICFSTFPYQLVTHTLDKNFMFLICNALLVFLTKYSGLTRSLSLSSHPEESRSKNFIGSSQSESSMQLKKLEAILVPESIDLVENFSIEEGNEEECYLTNQRETENEVVEDKEQEEKGQQQEKQQEKQQEQEENAFEKVTENEDENDWTKDEFLIEQKEEEEEDDDDNEEVGNGVLSTEELNKKFDEFIRRMKEELRIEAQRHLIMV